MSEASLMLRPWAFDKHEQPSITALLERVNRERGHFRDITTSSLQEELATQGALQLSDSDDDDSSNDADTGADESKTATREDLYKAKQEMLEKIAYAHNEVMMALDFVSLLASKDSAAGRQTMSQFLKDNVPAGTLGVDLWKQQPLDPAQQAKNLDLAHNVRVKAFTKSADEILDAAKSFESKVEAEVNYWNQINSITSNGWSLCRLPGIRQKLGVRFGFSESVPRFNQAGTVALDTDNNGYVTLAAGAETRNKTLRVSVYRQGKLCGRSGTRISEDLNALDASIRLARDSLFDEELFYELDRESRTMISDGVRMAGSSLTLPINDSSASELRLELSERASMQLMDEISTGSDNILAESLLCIARLLLSNGHREAQRRRTQIPPPLTNKPKDRPLLRILRPIMSYMTLDHDIDMINARIRQLEALLKSAGLSIDTTCLRLELPSLDGHYTADIIMAAVLGEVNSKGSIRIQASSVTTELHIAVRTSISSDDLPTFTTGHGSQQSVDVSTMTQALLLIDRKLAALVANVLADQSKQTWLVARASSDIYRKSPGADGSVVDEEARVEIDRSGGEAVLKLDTVSGNYRWGSSEHDEKSLLEIWAEFSAGGPNKT